MSEQNPRDPEKNSSWFHLLRFLRPSFWTSRGYFRRTLEKSKTLENLIEKKESILPDQKILMSNILKLHDRVVSDCMVPRADIVSLSVDTPFEEVIKKFAQMGHSRLPVYREKPDDIIGLVHIKDVIMAIAHQKVPSLEDLIRGVQIVAPSMWVLDLLLQMRQSHQHMALVIDEFGGIDGLVTIEDLVEEITGEIHDEHDSQIVPTVIQEANGTFKAHARYPLQEFERLLRIPPLDKEQEEERKDIDTLGGLIFSLAGRVPTPGEIFAHPSGIEFEVLDADPRRIKFLRIHNIPSRNLQKRISE